MGYTRFKNGFEVTSNAAVDRRIYLSKAEMLTAEDDYMLPDLYFCICTDDGKFYLYNVNNEANSETGKYRILDESITFTSAAAKEQLNEAIKNSVEIGTIKSEITEIQEDVTTLSGNVTNVTERVDALEPKVTSLETRVETLEPKVTDLEPRVVTLETNVDQAEEDIENIQQWISHVKLDGGEVKATYDLTPVTAFVDPDGSNPTVIAYNSTASLIYRASTGYVLPETVYVNGIEVGSTQKDCSIVLAKWTVDSGVGTLALSTPKNDISFRIVATAE